GEPRAPNRSGIASPHCSKCVVRRRRFASNCVQRDPNLDAELAEITQPTRRPSTPRDRYSELSRRTPRVRVPSAPPEREAVPIDRVGTARRRSASYLRSKCVVSGGRQRVGTVFNRGTKDSPNWYVGYQNGRWVYKPSRQPTKAQAKPGDRVAHRARPG